MAEGELSNYVTTITSIDGKLFTLTRNMESLGELPVVEGTVVLSLIREYDGEIMATTEKQVSILNNDIALTKLTNPEVYAIMWAKFGPSAGAQRKLFIEDCITKEEALTFTAADFQSGYSSYTSVFAGKNIKKFEELRYFTNVEAIPTYMFYQCTELSNVTLPENITNIGA